MQKQLDWHYPSLDIQIIGMNERGLDIGNESITEGRDLPWLQDVDSDGDGRSDVWLNSWDVEYRDVLIVDRDSTAIEAYNLTRHDLAILANFETLKQKFIEAAATSPLSPWQQPIEPLDVNNNGIINPLDALLVINDLGKYPNGLLPDLGGETPEFYIDTDGDGYSGPLDALLVINQLTVINSGMAEAAPVAAPLAAAATSTATPLANETLAGDETSSANEFTSAGERPVAASIESRMSPFQVREFTALRVGTASDVKTDLHEAAIDAALVTWDWL